ncbi:MAG: carboxylating nicotinate-nucleotide diphosphorylase [Verrucomicrobia bacterium]|nr:carboxylating nicotinate-nucleotide diphosphorylase [Verrucomicrobiota bacterium]
MSTRAPAASIARLVRQVLDEDIGCGDITTMWTVPANARGTAQLIAREAGVIAGLDVARAVFRALSRSVRFAAMVRDGQCVRRGTVLAEVRGPLRAILTGERVALNFLQRLSGVATLTRAYVERAKPAKVLDTRKTTPGLRALEKAAVRAGGGLNHRFGLDDLVLIKNNHIAAAGSITTAVRRVRQRGSQQRIEVETRTLDEVREAAALTPDIVMLDNMTPAQMRKAVALIRSMSPRTTIEASGGVTRGRVGAVAKTGVDWISVGALTHSAPALDIALRVAHTV